MLDIMLPSLNGHDIARRLRAEQVWTPVLMLTAKDGEYDEADGLDVGADDYLRKPFSFVVLVARLRALARRGVTPRPRLLSHGGLTLDPESGDCTVGGQVVADNKGVYKVTASLKKPSADKGLVLAPVTVHYTTVVAKGVLSVPATAIVGTPGGVTRWTWSRPRGRRAASRGRR